MEWIQILSLFLANAALIVWFRAESRYDWRQMDAKMEANHREFREFQDLIRKDMQDFHGRLCAIEERRLK